MYFAADNGTHGFELWKSDGTQAGTLLVKDIWPGLSDFSPARSYMSGGTLYFAAVDPTHGREEADAEAIP